MGMEKTPVYVLVTLGFSPAGEVTRKNMGVTFNIHDAEAFQNLDVSNEYETHGVDSDWRNDAVLNETVLIMREMSEQIRTDVEASLR